MTLIVIGSFLIGMGLVCLGIGIKLFEILRRLEKEERDKRQKEEREERQLNCKEWRDIFEKKILLAIKSATWKR